LAPEFHEVHRVEAFLRGTQGNSTAADACYDAAIDIEPNSAALRLWYAGFLNRFLDEPERAMVQLKVALSIDPTAMEIQFELANIQLALGDFDASEKTILALLTRVISSERLQKKVFDLMLQLYQRKAERSAGAGDYMKAIETLQSLKSAYDGIPPAYLDGQMIQKLKRAKAVARGCSRNVSDAGYRKLALNLEGRFSAELNGDRGGQSESAEDLHGQVNRWNAEKCFGFIGSSGGAEFFFHINSVISPRDQNAIRVGTRVVFNSEVAAKGPRAVNIEFHDVGL
jgi:cold shock CspA family protein/predicted Zn-dependent protease